MGEPRSAADSGAGTARGGPRRSDLDTLYCINPDGSRNTIHPADVRGRFQVRKKIVWAVLVAVYLVLPWIEIGGHPAVLLDIPERHFYLFGETFNAQDFYLAFFLLSGAGFALFVVSALWGRVWCGYACPHTVFLEGFYRRIEHWFEGGAGKRKRLEPMPWNGEKILRKGGKQVAYVLLSFLLAHTLLSYFMGVEGVRAAVTSAPSEHPTAFAFVLIVTGLVWFDFAWFREQLCIVLCPYGRLQGVLYDADTVVVGYDARRGEPRGKYHQQERGDCIDCQRCVAVCPTGIDIRNGTQMECVGCANCVDACDEVMERVGQPAGLIRYDSQNGFEGRTRRFLRPRLYLYGGLLALGCVVFLTAAVLRRPFEAHLRSLATPYVVTEGGVRYLFELHLVNKQPEAHTFRIEPEERAGLDFVIPTRELEVGSLEDRRLTVIVEVERGELREGMSAGLAIVCGDGCRIGLEAPMAVPGPSRSKE